MRAKNATAGATNSPTITETVGRYQIDVVGIDRRAVVGVEREYLDALAGVTSRPGLLACLVLCAGLLGCGGNGRTSAGVHRAATIPPDRMTCVHIANAGTSSARAEPCGGPTVVEVEPPAAVKQAGGRRLAQFEFGRTVIAQSGCLACHKLGSAGNRGPGPDLTSVGARLSTANIRRTLIHPREPMPSFKNLPPNKLKALIVFLSLLGH